MTYVPSIQERARQTARLLFFRVRNVNKKRFVCPICNYKGPFKDVFPLYGTRKHAMCPKCSALERHRLQFLVLKNILANKNTKNMSALHFAPEPFFTSFLTNRFGNYESADLYQEKVTHVVNIEDLPFDDGVYDFVLASHVLEHVPDDRKALTEIRRILKSNGIAVLPVPILSKQTVEYTMPNPLEENHVRAPGLDYYNRYKEVFSKVTLYRSDQLPSIYQLYLYEDRSKWPTKEFPLRIPVSGERHQDIVPVCYA